MMFQVRTGLRQSEGRRRREEPPGLPVTHPVQGGCCEPLGAVADPRYGEDRRERQDRQDVADAQIRASEADTVKTNAIEEQEKSIRWPFRLPTKATGIARANSGFRTPSKCCGE
ncbi:MAG: hypothetical protein MZV70_68910 [Desulfobacterales bacterium]|nr:hypothetical protein [Desulfobacterales bacterium]